MKRSQKNQEALETAFAAIAKGHDDSFDIIEEHFRPYLFDYLMRHTAQINRSIETVEEATYSMRPFLAQMTSLDELIWQYFKTARNFCADIWETDTRQLLPPPYPEATPVEVIRLEHRLRELTAEQRECLLLQHHYLLSENQILKITSLTDEQFRSVLQQAVGSLGEDLLEYMDGLQLYPEPVVSDDQTQDLSLVMKGVRRSSKNRFLDLRIGVVIFIVVSISVILIIKYLKS